MTGTGGTVTGRVTLTGAERHPAMSQLAAAAGGLGEAADGAAAGGDATGETALGDGAGFAGAVLVPHDATAASTTAAMTIRASHDRVTRRVRGVRGLVGAQAGSGRGVNSPSPPGEKLVQALHRLVDPCFYARGKRGVAVLD